MNEALIKEKALKLHQELAGKIEITGKMDIQSAQDLSLAYTPGVAESCRMIAENSEESFSLTARSNMVAIVTDGTAVLGMGDIGPEAAMPVMEGKSMLFKQFGGVDAFPICLDEKDPDEIVKIVKALEPTFGGVNLEDIAAPRCFEIEERLKKELNIPVFHDDQHGTAIVVYAALINALRLVKKKQEEIKLVLNGAGSAGIAIAKLLLEAGIQDITLVSLEGILCPGEEWMNPSQAKIAEETNRARTRGTLKDAIAGADVFIGVSGPGALTGELVQTMNRDAIVLALANPTPEIFPEEALSAGAVVVGTGRSDFPNQVNNVLAFPGIFRGALDVRASDITMEMNLAAARAIAELVSESELNPNYIIPDALDPRVASSVAAAVGEAAAASGAARIGKLQEVR
ncbi:NADP-dependent malic enzyme [Metabacillus idriensis]|uniref:NAD(P)-dependent malic enzyme n=1 Tax=Metabacillus idriensis TaxID=324768 RepID=UPI002813B001|nr:NADP-dependent malic enzyme [Metabacillus idriensis]MDR0140312.1 NADP-dependent malic enzyme [Metabacillus idriensis]